MSGADPKRVTRVSWPNQQLVREDGSGPGIYPEAVNPLDGESAPEAEAPKPAARKATAKKG